jgi:hypothetical protein
MGEEKNRKMQRLTKADIADMGKLQGLVEAANTLRERVARQFVIDAFRHKMSSLIPSPSITSRSSRSQAIS